MFRVIEQTQDTLVAKDFITRSVLDMNTGKGRVTWTPEGVQLKNLLHKLLSDESHPVGTEDPMRALMLVSSILETSAKKVEPPTEQ